MYCLNINYIYNTSVIYGYFLLNIDIIDKHICYYMNEFSYAI